MAMPMVCVFPVMSLGSADFSTCPLIDIAEGMSPARFFEDFGKNPRPVRIRQPATSESFNFWETHGTAQADGSRAFGRPGTFGDPVRVGGDYSPYTLTNYAYAAEVFHDYDIAQRFPLPHVTTMIDQRPVLSIGLNGTGERDIGHHYHPATAMRLLQGRKVWAIRPPEDRDCMYTTGLCTDPFDVCAYYAQPGAPEPACVQEAGDTIVVPDGWYHGTCNTATTIGWGTQGRSMQLSPPACHHCSKRDARGQLPYATTAAGSPLLSVAGARALTAELAARARGRDRIRLEHLGPLATQSNYMSLRAAFNQYIALTHLEHEETDAIRGPECYVFSAPRATLPAALPDATRAWLSSPQHTSLLVPVQGAPVSVRLRHVASGEVEERELAERHAALWVGDALDELRWGAPAGAPSYLVGCRVALVPLWDARSFVLDKPKLGWEWAEGGDGSARVDAAAARPFQRE